MPREGIQGEPGGASDWSECCTQLSGGSSRSRSWLANKATFASLVFLLRMDGYERLRESLYDDSPWTSEKRHSLVRDAAVKAGWEAMRGYDASEGAQTMDTLSLYRELHECLLVNQTPVSQLRQWFVKYEHLALHVRDLRTTIRMEYQNRVGG